MKRRARERLRARRAREKAVRIEIDLDDLKGLVERARAALSEQDHATLVAVVETLTVVTQELAAKGASLGRLRRLLFGNRSEKTSKIFGAEPPAGGAAEGEGAADAGQGDGAADAKSDGANGDGGDATAAGAGAGEDGGAAADEPPKRPRPGHGRNGADAYRGATRVKVSHPTLGRGDACPACDKGKVYPYAEPAKLVRIKGMAPLGATVYECDQLRCNLCQELFTAPAPPGVGDEKYDETAAAMIGMLKYGAGLPFNRIEKLEQSLGIPLPASTQWEVVERAAELLAPAHEGLVHEAAQGEVVHNDDTWAKILELTEESRREILTAAGNDAEDADDRSGVFTTGIVATRQGHRMALFATGPKHAGENLADVLRRRAAELAAPIQMCDALSRNLPGELQTLVANCMSHARRHFVEVAEDFPAECRFLLKTLGKIYKNDAVARAKSMSPDERLRFHQKRSAPTMKRLSKWLRRQNEERRVEPNSGLGQAIEYMRTHWKKLTLFLRIPGAPLDNNVCERALKKAILHRKNALFFKTLNGARVGDIFMSLIHTAELNGADPFDYLVALQRHRDAVARSPPDWMPWNYRDAVASLAHGPAPPSG